MKTIRLTFYTIALIGILAGCDNEDDPAPASSTFKVSVDGTMLNIKYIDGYYSGIDNAIGVLASDDTDAEDGNIIILSIDYSAFNQAGSYQFSEEEGDVLLSYITQQGDMYFATEGTITFQTLSTTSVEATFSNVGMLDLFGEEGVTLTNGEIKVTLKKVD